MPTHNAITDDLRNSAPFKAWVQQKNGDTATFYVPRYKNVTQRKRKIAGTLRSIKTRLGEDNIKQVIFYHHNANNNAECGRMDEHGSLSGLIAELA